MALAMLDKYATDPDFRDILRVHGAAVIPPIAQTDAGPETLAYLRSKSKRSFTESLAKSVLFLSGENGQSTIRLRDVKPNVSIDDARFSIPQTR